MDIDYTVFTHLIDERENIVAQHDGQPDAGEYPTSQWLKGEVVQDVHTLVLEPALQPGEYTLLVGMYDLESGERRPAYDQDGRPMLQNRIELTRTQVGE